MFGIKPKTSRFGATVSLVVVCALAAIFCLGLPSFWQSWTGKLFCFAWGGVGVFIATSHIVRVLGRKPKTFGILEPVLVEERKRPYQRSKKRGIGARG